MNDAEGWEIERGVRVRVFVGRDRQAEFRRYWEQFAAEHEGTISPGGAAAALGVTRQMVHKLIAQGKLRAVVYCDRPGGKAGYIEVSVRDVKERMRERGRLVGGVLRVGSG